MARPRKAELLQQDQPEKCHVLLRNFGWIEGGKHHWLAAGTELDPKQDAALIAFLVRSGASLRGE